jgi:hypothetical protein
MDSPALLEVQRALRASLVADDDAPAARHVFPAGRLEVYRNTFAGVLVNALRLSYPAVQKLVGEAFFEGAARAFIAGHPPASACLDDYGAAFPEFLAAFSPASSLAYLSDVARLEWAVCRALHARDAEALDPRCLAPLDGKERGRLRFVAHPAVSLLEVRYPAHLIWRAVLGGDDATLSEIDLESGDALLLVERRESGVEVTRLPEPEWRFASALFARRPLYAAIDEAGDFDAARSLAAHLAAGRFVAYLLG